MFVIHHIGLQYRTDTIWTDMSVLCGGSIQKIEMHSSRIKKMKTPLYIRLCTGSSSSLTNHHASTKLPSGSIYDSIHSQVPISLSIDLGDNPLCLWFTHQQPKRIYVQPHIKRLRVPGSPLPWLQEVNMSFYLIVATVIPIDHHLFLFYLKQ